MRQSSPDIPLHVCPCAPGLNDVRLYVCVRVCVCVVHQDGNTPLCRASALGHVKLSKFLVRSGGAVNSGNKVRVRARLCPGPAHVPWVAVPLT